MTILLDAIEEFLLHLGTGKRKNTIDAYRVALTNLSRFASDNHYSALTPVLFTKYAESLKGFAPATIHNYLSALSEFIRWLFINEQINVDAVQYERLFATLKKMRPRFSHMPNVATDEAIDAMLAAARRESLPIQGAPGDLDRARLRHLRDIAILLTLRTSGMRVGELVALKRGDLQARARSARVTGKGDKERTVYFAPETWTAIQQYLAERKDGGEPRLLADLPLFAAHDRSSAKTMHSLTTQSVERRFAELCQAANLGVIVTPHRLRATFATRMLDATDNLALVQDMLGHDSPLTTRRYAKVADKKIRDAHSQVFGDE